MLIIDSLTKVYDTDLLKKTHVALDNLSFRIKEGKIVGFLGPNGAGKTTTLKIILGFTKADGGQVIYKEPLGTSLMSALKTIGYAPERPYFYPFVTGREFIIYLGKLSGMSRNDIYLQMKHWAERLKIDHALDKKLKTYSKGMLQRIGFLTAVLRKPRLLILDEPASGLDPLGRKELKDAIKEVHELGSTVFFSTHIVSDVEEICSDLVLVKNGTCAYEGTIDKLILDKSLKTYVVKFYENDLFKETTVADSDLQTLLRELMSKNYKIYSVEPSRLSLEEIIYETTKAKK